MKISRVYRELLRYKINKNNRKRLNNTCFSVISSNCVGGGVLHELGLRFNAPTVNLFISSEDYIKFLQNLNYYLECDLRESSINSSYPIGLLDDIRIDFLHYQSFKIAKAKWEERCKRINKENLYVIMVQKDGCTDEMVKMFDNLPYEHKVIFTAREYPDVPSAYHIPHSELKDGEVMDLCKYKSKFTGKRWFDEYDFVGFFNNEI